MQGSTAMGDGLKLGLQSARTKVKDTDGQTQRVPSVLVLLSDGKSERGAEPVDVADAGQEAKIPIYTIALGTQTGVLHRPNGAVDAGAARQRDAARHRATRPAGASSPRRAPRGWRRSTRTSGRSSRPRRSSRRSRRRSPAPRSRCCSPPRARAAADGEAAVSRRARIAAATAWPRRSARPSGRAPGPIPPTVLRNLDLAVLRRVESLVPGEHLTPQVGGGTELALIRPYRPGDDVRHIDWNVTARLQRAARARARRRARDDRLAAARRVRLDDVRHRRPAQGRRRRGRRAGRRPRGDAARQPAGRGRAGRRRAARCCARARAASGCWGCWPSCAREPEADGAGATSLGTAVSAHRGAGAATAG